MRRLIIAALLVAAVVSNAHAQSTAGGIAEAFYGGVPEPIPTEVLSRLPQEFRDVIAEFNERFGARGE